MLILVISKIVYLRQHVQVIVNSSHSDLSGCSCCVTCAFFPFDGSCALQMSGSFGSVLHGCIGGLLKVAVPHRTTAGSSPRLHSDLHSGSGNKRLRAGLADCSPQTWSLGRGACYTAGRESAVCGA